MTDDFPSKTLDKICLCANGSAIAFLPTYAKVNYSDVRLFHFRDKQCRDNLSKRCCNTTLKTGPLGNFRQILGNSIVWIFQLQKYICWFQIYLKKERHVSIATLGRLFCHTGMDDTTLSVEKVEPKQKLPCNHFNCLYR